MISNKINMHLMTHTCILGDHSAEQPLGQRLDERTFLKSTASSSNQAKAE
jgi:hypothetical protein